jgi:uncharacterized protein with FMN-binding domain
MGTAHRMMLWPLATLTLCVSQIAAAEPTAANPTHGRLTRTRQQVLALIQEAGSTRPDWWDSVPLEYPESLDLSFPHPPPTKDWDTRHNVGQYMWSIINENPSRFQQGTKFMHYVLKLNEDDAGVVRRCRQQLAHCYHDLLQDWARAAYWKRRAGIRDVALANCYWQLGSKEMAAEILDGIRFDRSRYGAAIKQWADIGELDKALALAEVSGGYGEWGGTYRAAGDAYRKYRRYEEAIASYRQVLAVVSAKPDNLILKHNQDHARYAIDNIRLFETFDLSKVQDGAYSSGVTAYNGLLVVRVTVADHAITAVEIVEHHEKQPYSSLVDMPTRIMAAQDYRGIDATTGATVTADAIKNAVAETLSQGLRSE